MLMVGVYSFMRTEAGVGQEDGWRLSFLVPAIITSLVALGIITISDDSPRGDLNYLARRRKTTCTYSYSLPRVHDTRIAHSTLSRIIPTRAVPTLARVILK